MRRPPQVPTFMVFALRDAIGANLDRIQIVKGWLDARGEVHEKIYDVCGATPTSASRIRVPGRCR